MTRYNLRITIYYLSHRFWTCIY